MVIVSLRLGIFGPLGGEGGLTKALFIGAKNTGDEDVILTSANLYIGERHYMTLDPDYPPFDLPFRLSPGSEPHNAWLDPYHLAAEFNEMALSGIVQIVGSFSDSSGNEYLSKPFPFDVPDWLEVR